MPYSVNEIIDRMNWLGAQDAEIRDGLRAESAARGHHLPTGEQFLVNPPINMCWHCGAEYRGAVNEGRRLASEVYEAAYRAAQQAYAARWTAEQACVHLTEEKERLMRETPCSWWQRLWRSVTRDVP